MEIINTIVGFYQTNVPNFIELWVALIALASVIVKLTPTQKDDTILGKVVSFVGKFIALNKK